MRTSWSSRRGSSSSTNGEVSVHSDNQTLPYNEGSHCVCIYGLCIYVLCIYVCIYVLCIYVCVPMCCVSMCVCVVYLCVVYLCVCTYVLYIYEWRFPL